MIELFSRATMHDVIAMNAIDTSTSNTIKANNRAGSNIEVAPAERVPIGAKSAPPTVALIVPDVICTTTSSAFVIGVTRYSSSPRAACHPDTGWPRQSSPT
jgi:hypothetical protein